VREAVNRQSGVDESLLTSDRAYWDGYYYDENWVRNTEAAHFYASFGSSNASATHRGILLPHGDPVWINAPIQEEGTLHDAENIEAWHFPFSSDSLEAPKASENTVLFVEDIEATLTEQRGDDVIHWYQVTYATDDGEHTGWVCSQGQQHVSLHSQWGWPGFEVVDNTQLTLDQYFARQMLAGNNVTEEEKSTFQAPAQAVETGPIFERIYQIISKQMEPLLPPKNIPKTMCKPKVQQDLSRLIIEQPTEWQGSEPWSCLDDYMHDEAKPGWDATKEQIDKLAWWDEVNTKAKLNLGSTVMNIHPVALVENTVTKALLTWADSPFADLLGKVESNNDYTAYNKTTPKLESFYNTELTQLTISELVEKQKERTIFAAGRFQVIPSTLNAAISYLNLDDSTKYDKKTQDKIFDYLIRIKRPAIINYLEGNGSIEDAIYEWAKEFASAGVRKGKKISRGRTASIEGMSYYSGDGLNKSHIMPEDMINALKESKNNAYKYK